MTNKMPEEFFVSVKTGICWALSATLKKEKSKVKYLRKIAKIATNSDVLQAENYAVVNGRSDGSKKGI